MTLSDRKVSGSITAEWDGTGSEVAAAFQRVHHPAQGCVAAQVTGTFTATLTFEASVDGSTYVAVVGHNLNSGTSATTTTGTGIFLIHAPGAQYVRVRCSDFTSGTAVVTMNATLANLNPAALGTGGDTVDTELPAAVALGNNISQQTAPFVGGAMYATGTLNEHLSIVVAQALSDGSTGGRSLPSFGWIFNNSTWDRERMAFEVTLLASAARTTTQTSADIRTYNLRGISVVLDVTAIAATPSLVVTINGKDSTSGKYYNLLTSAAVVGVSTNVYTVYPGQNTAAGLQVNRPVPPIVQVVVTPADADSATYSLNYALHQ